MRVSLLFGLLLGFAVVVPASADEAAVKKMIGDYANAFNAKQLDTVMSFWTENGVHIDRENGERTEGRDAIRADIANCVSTTPRQSHLRSHSKLAVHQARCCERRGKCHGEFP